MLGKQNKQIFRLLFQDLLQIFVFIWIYQLLFYTMYIA